MAQTTDEDEKKLEKKRKAQLTKEYSKKHNLKDLFNSLFTHIKVERPDNLHRYTANFFRESAKQAGEDKEQRESRKQHVSVKETNDARTGATELIRQTTFERDFGDAKSDREWTMHVKKQAGENARKKSNEKRNKKAEFVALDISEQKVAGSGRAEDRRGTRRRSHEKRDSIMNLPKPAKPKKVQGRNNRREMNARKSQDQQKQAKEAERHKRERDARKPLQRTSSGFGSFVEGGTDFARSAARNAQQSFMEGASQINRLHNKSMRNHARQRQEYHQNKLKQAYKEKYGDHGTQVFDQVQEMKDHPAVFTMVITLAMIGVFAHSMATSEIAEWVMGVEMKTESLEMYNGVEVEQDVPVIKNMWYGPTTEGMLHYGAKFTPCMRKDDAIFNKTLQRLNGDPDAEPQPIKSEKTEYGSCTIQGGDCFQTHSSYCQSFSSDCSGSGCLGGARPTTFVLGQLCPDESKVVGRPCCYGIANDCHVLPEEYCKVLSAVGYSKWHTEAQQCSQVNCMEGLCGMHSLGSAFRIGPSYETVVVKDADEANDVDEETFEWDVPNQFWRFFSPIFMHVGVGHLVFNLLYQVRGVAEIENLAGPWNVAIMYFLSGFGGNIFAATMEGMSVSAGASSSLYGIIGVQTVDLFQSWQIIEGPWKAFFQQMFMNIIVLGIGTLPQVDNFAHVGGFVVGVVTGLAFLPYMHFSNVDKYKKLCLKNLAKIVIGVGTLGTLVIFYTAKDPEFCTFCKYINCVPYTNGLCDTETTVINDE